MSTDPQKIRKNILDGFQKLDPKQRLQVLSEVCIAHNYSTPAAWFLGELANDLLKVVEKK